MYRPRYVLPTSGPQRVPSAGRSSSTSTQPMGLRQPGLELVGPRLITLAAPDGKPRHRSTALANLQSIAERLLQALRVPLDGLLAALLRALAQSRCHTSTYVTCSARRGCVSHQCQAPSPMAKAPRPQRPRGRRQGERWAPPPGSTGGGKRNDAGPTARGPLPGVPVPRIAPVRSPRGLHSEMTLSAPLTTAVAQPISASRWTDEPPPLAEHDTGRLLRWAPGYIALAHVDDHTKEPGVAQPIARAGCRPCTTLGRTSGKID